jgi:hypothetical protein
MTDTNGIEYPDAAGYPDGTGTLDEGKTDDAAAEAAAEEVDTFALDDEEDVDGD